MQTALEESLQTAAPLTDIRDQLDELKTRVVAIEGDSSSQTENLLAIQSQLEHLRLLEGLESQQISSGEVILVPYEGGSYQLPLTNDLEFRLDFGRGWIPESQEYPEGVTPFPSWPVIVQNYTPTQDDMLFYPRGYSLPILGISLKWPPIPPFGREDRPQPSAVFVYSGQTLDSLNISDPREFVVLSRGFSENWSLVDSQVVGTRQLISFESIWENEANESIVLARPSK